MRSVYFYRLRRELSVFVGLMVVPLTVWKLLLAKKALFQMKWGKGVILKKTNLQLLQYFKHCRVSKVTLVGRNDQW